MADPCLHSEDWGRVIEMAERQHKEIYGNGKPGLNHQVTELSVKIESMNQSIKDLSTSVSALMKFENQFVGAEKAKDKGFTKYIQLAGFLVALTMAYFAYSTKMERIEKKIDYMGTPITLRGIHAKDTIK